MPKRYSRFAALATLGAVSLLAHDEPAMQAISTQEFAKITAEAQARTERLWPEYYREMVEEVDLGCGVRANIGSTRTFMGNNFKTNAVYKVPATLRGKGKKVQIWVENTQWASDKITQVDVDTMLVNLESKSGPYSANPNKGIYTLNTETFGDPPDYDKDGITDFLLMDIQDQWTPDGKYGFVGGYFSANDQGLGNKCDLLYVDTYPCIYKDATSPHDLDRACSVIAHEFQHLINFRYQTGVQSLWLNEALSQFAIVLGGYAVNTSVLTYLQAPNIKLPSWGNLMDPAVVNDYAKVQVWTTFLRDQFGLGIFKKMTQGPNAGIKNMDAALKDQNSSFAAAYQDYIVALSLNNKEVDKKYGFNYHYFENIQANPDVVTWRYPAKIENKSVAQYGVLVYRFTGGKNLSLTFNGKDCYAKLLKVGPHAIEVTDLASGTPLNDPQFGESYREALVMVGSTAATKSAFSLDANADTTGIHELAHDDGVPDPYITKPAPKYWAGVGDKKAGTGWAVQFDCPAGANQLVEITPSVFGTPVCTNEQSTVMLHLYKDKDGAPGEDLLPPVQVTLKTGWKALDVTQAFGQNVTVPERFYVGFTNATDASHLFFVLDQDKSATPTNRTWRVNAGGVPEKLFDLKDDKGNAYGNSNLMVHATVVAN